MDYFRSKRFLDTLQDWETGGNPAGRLEDYLPRMRALLSRMERPQQHYTSIVVGGTNGKGTVSSLLAALLRAAGRRVGLYTSPHLHILRERVQIDGQVVDKDLWAEGVTELYDRTRLFEQEGYGPFSRFEAITALAAHLFAREGVEYGVFEVGLGGRYDATNAWGADLAVLTSIDLDHTAVLGDTVEAIAAEKFEIARPGRPLLTTVRQRPEVLAFLRRHSEARGVDLHVVADEGLEALSERPATYVENARLALAAARYLLGDGLKDGLAREVVAAHRWPGRFEVARQQPCAVLDGAHNPAGAARLADDLRALSERWTFVVGVSEGHDAAGILRALAPLAKAFVFAQSGHARAMPVEALRACAPGGVPVRCEPDVRDALRELGGVGGPVCVTGSLYLVAQAREALELPHERDGFSEEVHLESLACLEAACRNLGVRFERASEDGNVMRFAQESRPVYFMRNKHPFNDYVSTRLAEDKAYQYELFLKAGLLVPYTLPVFNPFADVRFECYKTYASVGEIVEDVERQLPYPVVVKRNRASLAQGVFLEEDRAGLTGRLRELCENSGYFDNVLLVQAYVEGPEYRAVASRSELLLAYEKRGEVAGGAADLNPLHQAGGRAVKVEDPALLKGMAEVVAGVAGVLDLGFYAIDMILADAGFYILEVNPNPICYFYNFHNGRQDFVGIYERLLRKYLTDVSGAGLRVAMGGKG